MSDITLVGAPHTHDDVSVARTMGLVMLALLPATAHGIYLFGWPALNTLVLTLLSAVLAETLCLRLAGRPLAMYLGDGSALLSGWLLALTLPPWSPWWLAVLGGAIAIVIGKQVFGGLGQNLFNPAMVARVMLLVSCPVAMTQFTAPLPLGSAGAPDFLAGLAITFGDGMNAFDGHSGATLLGHLQAELAREATPAEALAASPGIGDWLLGRRGGSLGEGPVLLLLLGGLLLLRWRLIDWSIPTAMLGTLALLAGIFHLLDPARHAGPLVHLCSGGAILGAFFIATDLVTSPVSRTGRLIFGAGCGLLTYMIRSFGNYPEGVAFAVLLMNAATPLIDHYCKPRVYGRSRRGRPLDYPETVRRGESS